MIENQQLWQIVFPAVVGGVITILSTSVTEMFGGIAGGSLGTLPFAVVVSALSNPLRPLSLDSTRSPFFCDYF